MKAKTINRNGYVVVYRHDVYNSGPTTPSSWSKLVVTPGAMIQGNFHDPNNWNYTINDEQGWEGSQYQYNPSAKTKIEYRGRLGNGGITPFIPSSSQSLVYNMALERLNSKVRGALDLSIALAEARTTARMVKSISKVVDFARAVKRRFGSTKDIANGWLQWQYGWKPLASDIFNIADEATNIIDKAVYRTYASGTIRYDVNESVLYGNLPYGGTTRLVRKGKYKESCRLHVAVNVGGWDAARFSSLNPVSIAWELLPYSFVFDWFLDVGSYMRNLETGLLYGTAFRSGYRSDLIVYDGTEESDPGYIYSSSGVNYWSNVQRSIRFRKFSRSKLVSYPLPYLPKFQADLSSQRLFSAAALLRQILR